MAGLGWPEILGILAIIILIFGVGRIRKLGGELGAGIRSFREGLQGDDEPDLKTEAEEPTSDDAS
jgi:sec-independent protein translocase protein TatA